MLVMFFLMHHLIFVFELLTSIVGNSLGGNILQLIVLEVRVLFLRKPLKNSLIFWKQYWKIEKNVEAENC